MADDPTPPPAAPPATTPPSPTPPAAQPPAPATDPAKPDTDWKAESRKWEQRAKENNTAKETAAQQLNAVLKALGKNPDGTDAAPDSAVLTEQIDQYKAVAWENAVKYHVARFDGADVDALLDSNDFLNSLEVLVNDDPAGADFHTKLAAHVKAYVDKHPKFKATSAVPPRSGGDMTPGTPATPPTRPKSLMDAVSKHFKT